MGRYIFASVALGIAILLTATAHAQTTQPARGWQETVEQFSTAVRGNNLKGLQKFLDRGPVICTFNSEMLQPPERLLGATTGAKVLGMHAYLKTPSTLATDLAEDFKASDVPEGLRRDFVIPEEGLEKVANETAAKWVTQTLKPEGDQPIAVLVLWRQERADSFQNAAAKRPVFLLMRGEVVDEQYIIRQITYGDPLDRSR